MLTLQHSGNVYIFDHAVLHWMYFISQNLKKILSNKKKPVFKLNVLCFPETNKMCTILLFQNIFPNIISFNKFLIERSYFFFKSLLNYHKLYCLNNCYNNRYTNLINMAIQFHQCHLFKNPIRLSFMPRNFDFFLLFIII